ncbi:MAG: DUF1761 domain-containing protein [Acidobacteriaceae bacterium]
MAVSTVLYFLLGGVWFTFFMQAWLTGIGRTLEQLHAFGVSPLVSYGISLATTFVLVTTLSWVIQATGPQTALRGMKVALLLWSGFVFTTWATEYAFELRSLHILAINTGYPLVGMLLAGAVVGAWKKRTP